MLALKVQRVTARVNCSLVFPHFLSGAEDQVASLADKLKLDVAAAREDLVVVEPAPESELLPAGVALVMLHLVVDVVDVVVEQMPDEECLFADRATEARSLSIISNGVGVHGVRVRVALTFHWAHVMVKLQFEAEFRSALRTEVRLLLLVEVDDVVFHRLLRVEGPEAHLALEDVVILRLLVPTNSL